LDFAPTRQEEGCEFTPFLSVQLIHLPHRRQKCIWKESS